MATLGIELISVAEGQVEFSMPFNPDFAQHHGFMHAGALTTAMDSACGYAAFTLMPAGVEVLTVEFKSNFLAPAKGKKFRIQGEVVKAGRIITVAQATAYGITDGVEKAIATMTGTMMAVARTSP